MMMHVYYAWSFFVTTVLTFLFLLFLKGKLTLNSRFSMNTYHVLSVSFAIIYSIVFLIQKYIFFSLKLHFIVMFFLYSLFLCIFFEGHISKKIFFVNYYLTMLLIAHSISLYILTTLSNLSLSKTLFGAKYYFANTIINLVIVSILIYLSNFIKWKDFNFSISHTLFYMLLYALFFFYCENIISVIIFSYKKYHSKFMVSELNKSLFCYSILFYVLLHHIYLLKCSNTQKAKLEHENYKLSLEHDDYLKLTTELEPLKMLKHDLKSHLSTLELLAQNNKCEDSDVQQYIKRYLYDIDTCPLCNVTGIPILDCILSTHFFAAQKTTLLSRKI